MKKYNLYFLNYIIIFTFSFLIFRAEGSSRLSMRPLTPVDSGKMKTSPPKSGKMSQHSPSSFKECSPALTPVEPDGNRGK